MRRVKGPNNMADPKIRLEKMINSLKEQGHRLTPQRIAVLKILAESRGHPSVESIYEQVKVNFPTTSLATIYKTVALLKEMHEVLELSFEDQHNRYDGNKPYPHPHLICVKCNQIMDCEVGNPLHALEEMARRAGFRILDYRVDLFGICSQCQGWRTDQTSCSPSEVSHCE